jgi:hypothetical protein
VRADAAVGPSAILFAAPPAAGYLLLSLSKEVHKAARFLLITNYLNRGRKWKNILDRNKLLNLETITKFDIRGSGL